MKQIAPLTKIQYGIYAESASHLGEICYNLPYLYTLDKSLDVERLCRAVETAVKARPTLFTRIFLNDEGEPNHRRWHRHMDAPLGRHRQHRCRETSVSDTVQALRRTPVPHPPSARCKAFLSFLRLSPYHHGWRFHQTASE